MKIKNIFRIIYSSTIIIVLTILAISLFVQRNQELLNINSDIRYKSYQAAIELKQSSEDLTTYCRAYVNTGDPYWESKYYEVLDIRNGIKPRPDGRTIALKKIMYDLGFTPAELAKIEESETNSNTLVWTETVAFNAVKGLYADSNKQFTIKGAPNLEMARDLVFNKSYIQESAKIMAPISEFFVMLDLRTDAAVSKYLSKTKTLNDILFILVAVLLTMSIIAFIIITKKVLGVLGGEPKEMLDLANDISRGNFDFQFSNSSGTGMYGAMSTMADMIHSIMREINLMTENSINGNLDYRIDISGYIGEYKTLLSGVNATLDAVINPLNVAADYVSRISRGNIPSHITDNYNGDFNELKNNLNDCIDAINLLLHEVNISIDEALSGHLSYRADTSKHQGDYRNLMSGTNKLIDAFVVPIQELSTFLQGVAEGSSDIKRITDDYSGDFDLVKNNMNSTYDTLMFFLETIRYASQEAKLGNLDIKLDLTKAPGAWEVMLGGIQDIIDTSRSIINESGDALSIMATGDLRPRIATNYSGKFGEMRDSINNLGDSLTDLISQLQEAIHTTASASAEISSTADTLAAASNEQSMQTDKVATAMEEMSRTVSDNAHSASLTANVARQSGEVANNGGDVVRQTVEKMREIAIVVKTSAENISKLGASSKKIGEIIGVIDDIADQTNLLSLNAAIEAARAGEQGRGFAVVADSVGKLAVSTASATKEIAEMIKGIQLDTEVAVRAMEKGTLEVQTGIELADNAGSSLQDILNGINELLDMVNQIAVASEEQSATSDEISKNISSISKVTADSSRNIEDVAGTANELARMTEMLARLVSQFKVS